MAEELTTPGPWRWEINLKSLGVQLCGGRPRFDLTVMDPVRWGMGSASLRFRDGMAGDDLNLMFRAERYARPVPGREHHAEWFQGLRHPDAQLIEAAPDLLALARIIGSAYPNDPGTSDLDDEQPVTITLGVVRQAWAALAKVDK